jgi:hypothetical protein
MLTLALDMPLTQKSSQKANFPIYFEKLAVFIGWIFKVVN